MTTFEQQLDLVLKEIREILLKKNADYGSSFAEQFKEYGLTSYLIRDDDKTRRLKNLLHNENQVEESTLDTVTDKAGYALLALICLKEQEHTIEPVPSLITNLPDTYSNVPTGDWIKQQELVGHLQDKTSIRKPPYSDLDD